MLALPFGGDSPEVDPSAWVAPNATLIGDVTIREQASVFYGAVVRGDRDAIIIGPRSNLQDNVTVHGDPGAPVWIGTGVSVGHGAVIHGCTIEDDCLIGMHATVLNRAADRRGLGHRRRGCRARGCGHPAALAGRGGAGKGAAGADSG